MSQQLPGSWTQVPILKYTQPSTGLKYGDIPSDVKYNISQHLSAPDRYQLYKTHREQAQSDYRLKDGVRQYYEYLDYMKKSMPGAYPEDVPQYYGPVPPPPEDDVLPGVFQGGASSKHYCKDCQNYMKQRRM